MNISCYGAGVTDLVQLTGEVDVTDKASLNTFAADQWRRLSRTFGFQKTIEPGLKASLVSDGQLGSVMAVAIKAVTHHLKSIKPETMPQSAAEVRYNALSDASNASRGWVLTIDLGSLPGKGCFGDSRLIPAVNRETYFHPRRAAELTPRDCSWETEYPVFIGTWPWVYGHGLHGNPGALRWRRVGDYDPIALCAQLYANAWTLAGNASIDGRSVATHYEWFRKSTDDLIADVPTEPTNPGSLYRSDTGLLRVYMTDRNLRKIYINGPLGPVSVAAYNHILASFAAFFRVRSEIMTHHDSLPKSVQTILDQNPDPCIVKLRNPVNMGDELGL
ncbi:MAG: hypothetical protein ACPG4T_23310 [Nannocystaceae bacterium]